LILLLNVACLKSILILAIVAYNKNGTVAKKKKKKKEIKEKDEKEEEKENAHSRVGVWREAR
jgi:hypothetical protein